MLLYPLPGIDKCLHPGGNVVLPEFIGIPCVLPREYSTLQMGHHGKMATICRAYSRGIMVRSVRISRISVINIFCSNIVFRHLSGQAEPSFTMCNPDAELRSS